MSAPASSEHWLDRLAGKLTRRQVVKAGVVGAAALTLPVLRPAPARAEQFQVNVDACFTGCREFTHMTFAGAKSACFNTYNGPLNTFLIGYYTVTAGLFGTAGDYYAQTVAFNKCLDTAMMQQKVALFNCSQANCSNFNPRQKGGPCETCAQNCCVCPHTPLGYICCYYQCDDPDHDCCGN